MSDPSYIPWDAMRFEVNLQHRRQGVVWTENSFEPPKPITKMSQRLEGCLIDSEKSKLFAGVFECSGLELA